MRYAIAIVAIMLVLTACSSVSRPAHFTVTDVEFNWSGPIVEMTGYITNTGGQSAKYVELGVKLTSETDHNLIYATGWTNFVNFSPGEKRRFRVFFSDVPPGPFWYHTRWSTSTGGAMY